MKEDMKLLISDTFTQMLEYRYGERTDGSALFLFIISMIRPYISLNV